MLGVVTDDTHEKTVFSAFRMTFAYAGSFIALFSWEPLCGLFKDAFGYSPATSWQLAMVVIAAACFVLFVTCFMLTREHIKAMPSGSIGSDIKSLLSNKPWWLLIGAALCFNLFSTVRGATVAYFFADIIGDQAQLNFGPLGNILFYSGLFLGVGEISNLIGVLIAVPIAGRLGKKTTFMAVNVSLAVLSIIFFFIPCSPAGYWMMMLMQVIISLCTGIMSPLVWSMYADVSDYAELKYRTASTGLIFSSSSMAQKFGGAIGGAAVLWLLEAAGYITGTEGVTAIAQPDSAIFCLKLLMSAVPAIVAALAVLIVWFYPLTTNQMADIVTRLKEVRGAQD
jgi:GPH family glycoside/pentoside/hexuronide:cation symporter